MMLKIIPYLKNEHMLGSGPLSSGFEIAAPKPAVDEKGNSGVLLRNKRTGLFALYVGGMARSISNVNQEEAKKIAESV